WKIRIPLPDDREDTAMPDDFEAIAEAMRRRYITNDHWYRVTDHWWHAVSEDAIRTSDAGEQA
ncbi:MAG TPA: hypothetical protein DEG86_08030, partial [Halieaceae bacterium]|nr:hypothetical protein [Halieaceae bacterium]